MENPNKLPTCVDLVIEHDYNGCTTITMKSHSSRIVADLQQLAKFMAHEEIQIPDTRRLDLE